MEEPINTNLTPEQVTEEVKKLEQEEKDDKTLTEVTNLASEEKKQGAPVQLTKEQMKNMAAQDFIAGMEALKVGMKQLSARGRQRVFFAALQLPQEGTRVYLQNNEEKALFGIAQRVINARTSLVLHYIEEEVTKAKKEREEQKLTPSELTPKEEVEANTILAKDNKENEEEVNGNK